MASEQANWSYQSHRGTDCLIQIETSEGDKVIFIYQPLAFSFQKNFIIEHRTEWIEKYHKSPLSRKCWEYFLNLTEYLGDDFDLLTKHWGDKAFFDEYRKFSEYYGLNRYFGLDKLMDIHKNDEQIKLSYKEFINKD